MNRRTILIVDDDEAWLRSVSGFFKFFNYDIRTALTCAEGLEVARQHRPNCVLLDFHLPDAEADFFCSRIREDQNLKKTPIIIVSVDGEQECGSYLKCEADAFVMKGGPLNTIRFMVESLLRRVCWERGIIEKGDMRLETENLMVFRLAKPFARLSLEQFRFLFILVERSPCFVSENDILEFVFGADTVLEKFDALRGLATRLRAKLGRRIGRRIKNRGSSGWIYVQPREDKRMVPKQRQAARGLSTL
jgi:DNA-binding response OmpR family regulator